MYLHGLRTLNPSCLVVALPHVSSTRFPVDVFLLVTFVLCVPEFRHSVLYAVRIIKAPEGLDCTLVSDSLLLDQNLKEVKEARICSVTTCGKHVISLIQTIEYVWRLSIWMCFSDSPVMTCGMVLTLSFCSEPLTPLFGSCISTTMDSSWKQTPKMYPTIRFLFNVLIARSKKIMNVMNETGL